MNINIDNLINQLANVKINVTENNIIERLNDSYRWPLKYMWGQSTLEVLNTYNGEKIPLHYYFYNNYVDSNKVLDYYNNGNTIILSNIGNLFNDFNIIQNILNNFFKKNININLYMGKGSQAVSFPSHNHDYDVIVKNIHGDSDWVIDNKKICLSNQDCLFLPKYSMHEVVKIDGIKCSLTCNIE